MRILFIVHHRRWRAAYRSRAIASELSSRGHQVTLLVTADTERWRFRETMETDGVRIVESPDLTWGRLRSGWDPICAIRRSLWVLRESGTYDLVHLFETRPATILPGLVAQWRNRSRLIIDWIDWWGRGGAISINRPLWYRLLFGWFETFFEEHFRTYADGTTTICLGLCRRAIGLGVDPDTILQMRNGTDLTASEPRHLQEGRRRLGLPADTYIIGYSAQDTFFDLEPVFQAVRLLLNRGINVMMAMSGYPPPHIRQLITQLELERQTRFIGYLSREDYSWFLASCDVLVCPFPPTVYNLGRWPGKFGDYCAAARPIVFNPEGDLAEFAEGDRIPGITCAFEASAIAEAFLKLYESPEMRRQLGTAARSRALSDFTWGHQVDRLEQFYSRVIAHQFEQLGKAPDPANTGGLEENAR
jgi:glycosyltransferase involved in cell wall biosynthesis